MSSMFNSVEEAKAVVASMVSVDPATFEEVEGLHVVGMEAFLLDDPDTSETVKQNIRDKIKAQKGFKFRAPDDKEIKIVIGPFRDGFDCWVIGDNGYSVRI